MGHEHHSGDRAPAVRNHVAENPRPREHHHRHERFRNRQGDNHIRHVGLHFSVAVNVRSFLHKEIFLRREPRHSAGRDIEKRGRRAQSFGQRSGKRILGNEHEPHKNQLEKRRAQIQSDDKGRRSASDIRIDLQLFRDW